MKVAPSVGFRRDVQWLPQELGAAPAAPLARRAEAGGAPGHLYGDTSHIALWRSWREDRTAGARHPQRISPQFVRGLPLPWGAPSWDASERPGASVAADKPLPSQASPKPKQRFVFQEFIFHASSYRLYSFSTSCPNLGHSRCPHRSAGNATLNPRASVPSPSVSTARLYRRGHQNLGCGGSWDTPLSVPRSSTTTGSLKKHWLVLNQVFFFQLLIVALFPLVLGDKANKAQDLSLFCNTVTFKQGKWELSNGHFDIAARWWTELVEKRFD